MCLLLLTDRVGARMADSCFSVGTPGMVVELVEGWMFVVAKSVTTACGSFGSSEKTELKLNEYPLRMGDSGLVAEVWWLWNWDWE